MADDFNPYREWLGLDGDRPPNYYELLGLSVFESDLQRIAVAAERARTKVRAFRPGAQTQAWARLLDEIQAAKDCLCDPARKTDYDADLRCAASAQSWAAGPSPIYDATVPMPVVSAAGYAAEDPDLPMAVPVRPAGIGAAANFGSGGLAAPDERVSAATENSTTPAPRAGWGLIVVGVVGLALLIAAAAALVILSMSRGGSNDGADSPPPAASTEE